MNNTNNHDVDHYITGALGTGMVYKNSASSVGLKTVYHGTSKANAQAIKKQGFRPRFGGSEGGASVAHGKAGNYVDHFIKQSKGKVHVSGEKGIAKFFAGLHGKGNGKVLKAYVSHADFNKHFTVDQDVSPFKHLAATTQRRIHPSQIAGSNAKFKVKAARRFADMARGIGTPQQKMALAGVAVGAGLLGHSAYTFNANRKARKSKSRMLLN